MHYLIFKPLPVKYSTINLKDHIPSNSHPTKTKDTLLGNSFPIHFGKNNSRNHLYSIFCTKDLS